MLERSDSNPAEHAKRLFKENFWDVNEQSELTI
jgi:hypothetical protein